MVQWENMETIWCFKVLKTGDFYGDFCGTIIQNTWPDFSDL